MWCRNGAAHTKERRLTKDQVARRLAQDAGYRAKCRHGLQEATANGGRVLDRVKRLNDFIANGLVLDDEADNQGLQGLQGAALTSRRLPWESPRPSAPPPQTQQQQQNERRHQQQQTVQQQQQQQQQNEWQQQQQQQQNKWQQQQQQEQQGGQQQEEHPQIGSPRSSPPLRSPQGSNLEEEDDEALALATWLQAAHPSVELRQQLKQAATAAAASTAAAAAASAAALTIQCHYRRHKAQALLRELRERKLAADRLVACVLSAAYQGVCGRRRSLARAALTRRLVGWGRRLIRRRQGLAAAARREAAKIERQLGQAEAAVADAGVYVQKLHLGSSRVSECKEACEKEKAEAGAEAEAATTLAAAAEAAEAVTEASEENAGAAVAAEASRPAQGTTFQAEDGLSTGAPGPAQQGDLIGREATPPPATWFGRCPPIDQPLPSPGYVGSARQGSSQAQVQHQHTFLRSSASSGSRRGSGSLQATPPSCLSGHSLSSSFLPPTLGGQQGQQGSQGLPAITRTASGDSSGSRGSSSSGSGSRRGSIGNSGIGIRSGGMGGSTGSSCGRGYRYHEMYRRTSSIQLLEAVQLGLNEVQATSVASQAALEACERTQERAQELQLQRRTALRRGAYTAGSVGGDGSCSKDGGIGSGGGRIARVGSCHRLD